MTYIKYYVTFHYLQESVVNRDINGCGLLWSDINCKDDTYDAQCTVYTVRCMLYSVRIVQYTEVQVYSVYIKIGLW